MVGLDLAMLSSLVAADRPEQTARRAVEVLTDLSLRGYPAQRALAVVERIEVREPAALDRLPALLDTIRRDQALSPAEAADALARGLAVADSLQGGHGRERQVREQLQRADGEVVAAADIDRVDRAFELVHVQVAAQGSLRDEHHAVRHRVVENHCKGRRRDVGGHNG